MSQKRCYVQRGTPAHRDPVVVHAQGCVDLSPALQQGLDDLLLPNSNRAEQRTLSIWSYLVGISAQFQKLFDKLCVARQNGDEQRRIPLTIDFVHVAATLEDLRVPPGNRLEALTRDRRGQHSIRINDQWRICFRFESGHAFDVEIVDYH